MNTQNISYSQAKINFLTNHTEISKTKQDTKRIKDRHTKKGTRIFK